jgi:hypothetical protein
MKLTLQILIIGTLFGGCNSSSNKNKLDNSTKIITSQNDCVFDLKTQTDKFISDVPEFSNYTWDDYTKTAIITLKNGEELKVIKGGCNHFEVSG